MELRRQVKNISRELSEDPEKKRSERQAKKPNNGKNRSGSQQKTHKTGKNRVYHYVIVEDKLM